MQFDLRPTQQNTRVVTQNGPRVTQVTQQHQQHQGSRIKQHQSVTVSHIETPPQHLTNGQQILHQRPQQQVISLHHRNVQETDPDMAQRQQQQQQQQHQQQQQQHQQQQQQQHQQ